jgi:RES domain
MCWKCFDDKYLSDIVRKEGAAQTCSVCRRRRKAITIERLGELLEPVLSQHLELGALVGDQEAGYDRRGDPLSFWVQEVLGECHGLEDEIVDAVIDAEDVDPHGGDPGFFDSSEDYESHGVSIRAYQTEWQAVEIELKTARRFFSSSAREFFDRLFLDVEKMQSWSVEAKRDESVVRTFPQDSRFYRARKIDHSQLEPFSKEPFKSVGPPTYSGAGRMNVDGVVVFYGAMDYETCLAEMRPPLGGMTAVIEVATTSPLHLLDFTRLEQARGLLSYFQPDFTAESERQAFLRHVHGIVSQPVIPGRESDYLITQTLAEYLAHVYARPVDGILFRSVQRKGGVNVVLFPKNAAVENAATFPLNYVAKSFKVYSTQGISYDHSEKPVGEWKRPVAVDQDEEDFYGEV